MPDNGDTITARDMQIADSKRRLGDRCHREGGGTALAGLLQNERAGSRDPNNCRAVRPPHRSLEAAHHPLGPVAARAPAVEVDQQGGIGQSQKNEQHRIRNTHAFDTNDGEQGFLVMLVTPG